MGQTEWYYWVRLISWTVDVIAFWVYFYKYVNNNWTGKKHDLDWPACGCWAGTLVYAVSVGEILYRHDADGGIRVFVASGVVFFWAYIAVFRIKNETELQEFESSDEL